MDFKKQGNRIYLPKLGDILQQSFTMVVDHANYFKTTKLSAFSNEET